MCAAPRVPPFVRIPAHVDAYTLYSAAESVERKLYAAMPEIDKGLYNLEADYSGSDIQPEAPGYWVEWFHRKAGNFLSYLQVYVYVISMAIPESKADFAKLRLLDFGGGWGLMSLLAKEAGIGDVTYLDIDPGTTGAIRVISEAVGLPLDSYVCGSEEVLLAGESERFDSVVSTDAIEHVYDIRSLFMALSHACAPGAFVFHLTGANPKNVRQRLSLTRMHRQVEEKIVVERRRYIESTAPNISEPELSRLAVGTRGLNKNDLQLAIERYLVDNTFPILAHPTNTCQLSGYWYDRLMDPYDVAKEMANYDFRSRVTQTFWSPGRSRFRRRVAKHALNFLSSLSISIGLRVTFSYGIHGVKQ